MTARAVVDMMHKMMAAGATAEAMLIAAEAIAVAEGAAAERRQSEAQRTARYRERRGISQREWDQLRRAVLARDAFTCAYCGKSHPRMDVDHVVPLIAGGETAARNLVASCPICTARKGIKDAATWMCGGRGA